MHNIHVRRAAAVVVLALLTALSIAGPASAAKGGDKGKPPRTTTTTTTTTAPTTTTTTIAPPAGPSWIVTIGDSAISGESGRWAGNTTSLSSSAHDTGADAYFDNGSNTAETTPGCHRSKSPRPTSAVA